MNLKEYQKNALKTESNDFEAIKGRLRDETLNLTYEQILQGLNSTLLTVDDMKKKLFYGKIPKPHKFHSYIGALSKIKSEEDIRVLHAILGILTEGQELLDGFMRGLLEENVDKVNLSEEVADVAWYKAILMDAIGEDWERSLEKNIEKLKARYGEKFSEEKAIDRDLVKEREILEGE